MTSNLVMGQRLLLATTVVTFFTLEKSIGIINVCHNTTVTTSHMIDQGPLALAFVVAPLTLEVQLSFSSVNRLLVLVQEVIFVRPVVAEIAFVVPGQSCRRSRMKIIN